MKLAQQPIVDRLKTGGCANSDGLIEYAALTAPPRALPAWYVVPVREAASENALSGARDQRVTVSFAVFILLAAGQRRGATIAEDLKAACDLARDALTGWTHPEASSPTDYAGGELVATEAGLVVWQLRFTTRYHERKPR